MVCVGMSEQYIIERVYVEPVHCLCNFVGISFVASIDNHVFAVGEENENAVALTYVDEMHLQVAFSAFKRGSFGVAATACRRRAFGLEERRDCVEGFGCGKVENDHRDCNDENYRNDGYDDVS